MFGKDNIINSAALQGSYQMTASNHLQLAVIMAAFSLCRKVLCNVAVGLVCRFDKGSTSLVGVMELPTLDPRFDGAEQVVTPVIALNTVQGSNLQEADSHLVGDCQALGQGLDC